MPSGRLLVGVLATASFTAVSVSAHAAKDGHGFIGYGIPMYHPTCATACQDVVPKVLFCGDDASHEGMDDMEGMDMRKRQNMDMPSEEPSPACISTNIPYLQTMAYCIATHCDESVTPLQRESWWYDDVVGLNMPNMPLPVLSYHDALASITVAPSTILAEGEPLVNPVLVDEEAYLSNFNARGNFELSENRHSRYGIILLVTCSLIPIFLSLLRFLPLPATFVSKTRAYFIDAPLYGGHVKLPVFGQVATATRGQTLFMGYILGINIVLSSIGYRAVQPNSWFDSKSLEIASLISNRVGVLSFANVPLLILFAGRNNILLAVTNWSHATYLLLHRCVAFLCVIEACLHSAIYLQIKLASGEHASESKLPYWILGIVATLAMSLLLPLSIHSFRRKAYEVFLAVHIVLSVGVIVGCWYHIIYRFENAWGYETWMYAAVAIWSFDRIARVARVASNGVKQALVYKIDDDYLRIDILDIDCSGHIFLYFLSRFWENHPFSVASFSSSPPAASRNKEDEKLDRESSHFSASDLPPRERSVTLLVRVQNGMTRKLVEHAVALDSPTPPTPVKLLVESSYGHTGADSVSSRLSRETGSYPNVLCIAGGVGITALLPLLGHAAYSPQRRGTVKLYWSARTAPLVAAVEELVADRSRDWGSKTTWGAIEAHVTVGQRLQLDDILDAELDNTGTLVLVSGPASMSEEVRRIVARKAQGGAIVRFVEECFDW